MKAQFRTISEKMYQARHGKTPRGYGNWGFVMVYSDGTLEVVWAGWKAYAEAKAWAIEEATRRGASYVEVAK